MSAVLNNAFKRYLQTSAKRAAQVTGPSAVSGVHEGGYQVWKKLFYFVACPSIILCAVNCYLTHMEHAAHPHERKFVKYEYMAVRTKPFPWGDGNHSLFHNPKVNALPTGYEE
ncbi:cytochrome c oxidase subunit 6A2, mitochondrial-like [Anthonomus grandis grandis]|uniref:cytochrome c oxidase subunit 6A2, mitochondrial-like n=1 Tax=Anthonomus grandis grandis TaxID=2921223 RepID=UPI0021663604|nr:cytochrome c oxidase subunit 6A2, mitochondrial-like [Anthonomus grandis grandis]